METDQYVHETIRIMKLKFDGWEINKFNSPTAIF